MIILFVVVIGGIYGGIFTPVEAGGVGAFGAFAIALARRKLTRDNLIEALADTTHISCMIFAIIIGAVGGRLAPTALAIARGQQASPTCCPLFLCALSLARCVLY